jgi:hypothetical protein
MEVHTQLKRYVFLQYQMFSSSHIVLFVCVVNLAVEFVYSPPFSLVYPNI